MPLLSEAARHLVYPSTITDSVFPAVEDRLAEVGIGFDDWQRGFGTVSLGLDETGTYASTVGGVVGSIPRQVGKTFTVGNLLIGLALEFPGLRGIWTSHHGSTTKNTLQSMEGMVRKPRLWPHIRNVYTNNNDMRILFTNGSVIMFGAREHGFGRGMDAIDVLVFDEAQKLGIKALEDMVPATNQAQNEHGALVFFIGTPPRPADDGEAFSAKRQQALSGNQDNDMVYVEFSADPDASVDDRSQWPKMNPSYPSRTPLVSMLRMRKNLPDDDAWRREAMGIWDDNKQGQVIPANVWSDLRGEGPAADAVPDALAVDMSPDRWMVIAACWSGEGSAHIELVSRDRMTDTAEAATYLAERAKARRIPVVLYNGGATAAMLPLLKRSGVDVVSASGADMGKACGLLLDEAMAGRITHAGQPELDTALASAKKRNVRDAGTWVWDFKESTVAPLVAVTLALWGAVEHARPALVPAIY